ncbi:hypothetical protein REPUB_Repub01dG0073000 [Reevesia pubescens]
MLDLSRRYDCPSEAGDSSSSPYQFCQLGGTLNPSLLNLTHLNYLDVSKNNFLGIPIPNFIGSFKNLKHLDLNSANFTGMVPPHLGNLSNLVYLDLEMGVSNSEELWVSDLERLSSLSSLQYLNLGNVNLSQASTNWLQNINMLPSLLELYLSSCQLYDLPQTLPFVNFTSLQTLELSFNHFSSSLPDWLFNFSSLVEVTITNSNLTGPIPKVSVGNLCNLQVLDLSSNSIGGEIEELIDSLSRYSNSSLETLDLSANNLAGILPDSLWSLKSLKSLVLYSNKLTGKLSDSLGSLSYLEYLELSHNLFSGPLPK